MSTGKFAFGDRVRHPKRPEWGIGTVLKTQLVSQNGDSVQNVTARFSNAGVKTISTSHAPLEKVSDDNHASAVVDETPTIEMWDRLNESGWLGEHARRKIEEVMIRLPLETRDVFLPMRKRLEAMLSLYRFDNTGRGLIDWAVAQSGLHDPLTRFTRQELEQLFDRWVRKRDEQLANLLAEADDPQMLEQLLANAPSTAQKAAEKARALR